MKIKGICLFEFQCSITKSLPNLFSESLATIVRRKLRLLNEAVISGENICLHRRQDSTITNDVDHIRLGHHAGTIKKRTEFDPIRETFDVIKRYFRQIIYRCPECRK